MINYATWAFASTLALNRTRSVWAASRSSVRLCSAVPSSQGSAPAGSPRLALPQLRRPPSVSLVPFHRRGKPTLWAGFPLGVFSEKASLLSHGEAPLRPASPSADTPHPFSPKLSRFRACSFVAAETAPAPRFSQSLLWGGSLQSRARRKPELEYSQGFSLGPALPFPRTTFPRRRISFGAHGDFAVI